MNHNQIEVYLKKSKVAGKRERGAGGGEEKDDYKYFSFKFDVCRTVLRNIFL